MAVINDSSSLSAPVYAYRAVAGLTTHHEVLSPCGHEVGRFDQTAGFVLAQQLLGQAMFPRSRLCPVCPRDVARQVQSRVTGPPQLNIDWGERLTGREREANITLFRALLANTQNAPDPANWKTLSPEQRGVIAQAGERFAQHFGLMFREWLSLNPTPAPLLTQAGLSRLKSSDTVKQQRIEDREQRARRLKWERN